MILNVSCDSFSFILNIVGYLLKLIQWAIPLVLIALITFDFTKAMISGDEKKSKEATAKAGKRVLYAIILFLVPILVKFTFRMIGEHTNISGVTEFFSCVGYIE